MLLRFTTSIVVLMFVVVPARGQGRPIDEAGFEKLVAPFFKEHCHACHGPSKKKGDLTLHDLKLADFAKGETAGTWAGILERLATGNMPPDDQPRPNRAKLDQVVVWIRDQLLKVGHGTEFAFPEKGNHVPHNVLFGSKSSAAPSTPARIWRITPYQYDQLFGGLSNTKRVGEGNRGLPLPFGLRGGTGLQDYAFLYRLDEAQTEQLMLNAKIVAERMPQMEGFSRLAKISNEVLDGKVKMTDGQIASLVTYSCLSILKRNPSAEEASRYEAFFKKDIEKFGPKVGIQNGLVVVLLHPEAVFRMELGAGKIDELGRLLLAPRELANAIAFAFGDSPPDRQLLKAVAAGKLSTREEVRAQVDRYWNYSFAENQRIVRFFQEYFGYTACPDIFKDEQVVKEESREDLVRDTDALVTHILENDKHVLEELLTTNKTYVQANGWRLLRKYRVQRPDLKHPFTTGNHIYQLYGLPLEKWSEQQPLELSREERAGILTQPSWLIAHSTNDANDAIHRGKWVRERLLGGAIPDTPITVQAQLPDEPKSTLREKMRVTREEFCWKCHQRMDPLGLSFEMFDGWGRFRTLEQGKPVDASGAILHSPDAKLDGPVKDSLELVRRLAKSEHVHQVFVRHAFRYWLGRNETPEDAPTLQAAFLAYKDNGGSMKSLVTSLIVSDSFLYRTPMTALNSAVSRDAVAERGGYPSR